MRDHHHLRRKLVKTTDRVDAGSTHNIRVLYGGKEIPQIAHRRFQESRRLLLLARRNVPECQRVGACGRRRPAL